jgi:hypothetical protein
MVILLCKEEDPVRLPNPGDIVRLGLEPNLPTRLHLIPIGALAVYTVWRAAMIILRVCEFFDGGRLKLSLGFYTAAVFVIPSEARNLREAIFCLSAKRVQT